MDTVGVAGFDPTTLRDGGATTGDSGVDNGAIVGDGISPLTIRVFVVELTGDVGNDRAHPGYLGCFVIQLGKRGRIDPNLGDDEVATNIELTTVEKVEGNIRTELIHRARLAVDLEATGQRVDIGNRTGDVIGAGVEDECVGGDIRSRAWRSRITSCPLSLERSTAVRMAKRKGPGGIASRFSGST